MQSALSMDDLNRALEQIGSIRRQVARSTEFRGYGPATLGATGLLAIAAAAMQARLLANAPQRIPAYLGIWITTAVLAASLIGVHTCVRARRVHSGMADEMLRIAVEQFLPAAAAGALITYVLVHYAPATLWMLPGLWQVTFSLGVFSSCRFLPRPMAAAGVWYMLTGLFCLSLADARAFSPWAMGIPYGAGQLLVAGILLFNNREAGQAGGRR
jgi:hypothetical protein